MSRRATWLAEVLRAAGCEVVEVPGWEARGATDRSGRPLAFEDLRAVIWHHDASPVGPSPGLPRYMAAQIEKNKAGANTWVDMFGRWHVIAAGVTYHAGEVLHGKPGNRQSIGVETDHTTGEPWPAEQLAGLRIGTAAILRHMGEPATALEFHRTICSPIGRKSDPAGLDLLDERIAVAHHMLRGQPAPAPFTPTHQEDLLMAAAHNDHDARWALVLLWFVDYLGREPTTQEHDFHVKVFNERGAGACLAGLITSPESRKYRASRAA